MEKTVLDLINCLGFELASCVLVTLNILSLYKDKVVRGISLMSAGFYACWAWWNVFYYFSLCQTFSYWAGILVAVLTTWWIVLAVYYKKKT